MRSDSIILYGSEWCDAAIKYNKPFVDSIIVPYARSDIKMVKIVVQCIKTAIFPQR